MSEKDASQEKGNDEGSAAKKSDAKEMAMYWGAIRKIVIFLFLLLLVFGALGALLAPKPSGMQASMRLLLICTIAGGAGGCLYSLRAVYLHACYQRDWDPVWHLWYYVRPLVALVCGSTSWLLMKAGLLALSATQGAESATYGYAAVAFIAGVNVENFAQKLRDVAAAIFGSRTVGEGGEVGKKGAAGADKKQTGAGGHGTKVEGADARRESGA